MGSQRVRHDRRNLACTYTCGLERFQVSSPVELGFKLHNMPTAAAKSLQSCPTLCNPIDGSPPGSPVPGILQARTLEWVAISWKRVNSSMHESEK